MDDERVEMAELMMSSFIVGLSEVKPTFMH